MSKPKITKEGDLCRKCGTEVKKMIPMKNKGKTYYFTWYLKCPKCNTMYMVEAAKVIR